MVSCCTIVDRRASAGTGNVCHAKPSQPIQARPKDRAIAAPGVDDMVSLRMASAIGFDALYMTGYGTVASHLGLPDAGLAGYADMVGRVEAMARMAGAP